MGAQLVGQLGLPFAQDNLLLGDLLFQTLQIGLSLSATRRQFAQASIDAGNGRLGLAQVVRGFLAYGFTRIDGFLQNLDTRAQRRLLFSASDWRTA